MLIKLLLSFWLLLISMVHGSDLINLNTNQQLSETEINCIVPSTIVRKLRKMINYPAKRIILFPKNDNQCCCNHQSTFKLTTIRCKNFSQQLFTKRTRQPFNSHLSLQLKSTALSPSEVTLSITIYRKTIKRKCPVNLKNSSRETVLTWKCLRISKIPCGSTLLRIVNLVNNNLTGQQSTRSVDKSNISPCSHSKVKRAVSINSISSTPSTSDSNYFTLFHKIITTRKRASSVTRNQTTPQSVVNNLKDSSFAYFMMLLFFVLITIGLFSLIAMLKTAQPEPRRSIPRFFGPGPLAQNDPVAEYVNKVLSKSSQTNPLVTNHGKIQDPLQTMKHGKSNYGGTPATSLSLLDSAMEIKPANRRLSMTDIKVSQLSELETVSKETLPEHTHSGYLEELAELHTLVDKIQEVKAKAQQSQSSVETSKPRLPSFLNLDLKKKKVSSRAHPLAQLPWRTKSRSKQSLKKDDDKKNDDKKDDNKKEDNKKDYNKSDDNNLDLVELKSTESALLLPGSSKPKSNSKINSNSRDSL